MSASVFQFTTSQGGRRYRYIKFHFDSNLSIHDLTRRSTATVFTLQLDEETFQFTTSQGGRLHRLYLLIYLIILSIHDLTRRSTDMAIIDYNTGVFQFTTSQGGRLACFENAPVCTRSFNSRPHKEVDRQLLYHVWICNLSIHDLTRRSTRGTGNCFPCMILSIHDLTRRSTQRKHS